MTEFEQNQTDSNQSMEDAMNSVQEVNVGDVVKGEVLVIEDKQVVVGIEGAGVEGVIPAKELSTSPVEEINDIVKVGDVLDLVVISTIGKDKEKQQAAQAFVNYISRPDNVVRNMYYVGYTSVISGGEDKTIYDYIKYMYGSEDKKSVDYDLNYFFQQNGDNYNYVMKTSEEMSKGQLYAQYPTQDVMRRSAVMTYFGDQAIKRSAECGLI